MNRRGTWGIPLVVLLAACSNQGAVDPERLASLRDSGLAEDRAAQTDERLQRILERDNATGALAGPYGGQETPDGAIALGSLLVSALERNATIGAAAQDITRADAERLNAIFGYLPQVTFEVDYSQVNQQVVESDNAVFLEGEADFPVLNYNLLVNQPIIDLSRIFGIQYATNARTLAEVNYIAAVRDVSFEVLDAYLVALQAERQAGFLQQRQALISRQVESRVTLEEIGLGDVIAESSLRGERASLAAQQASETAREVDAMGRLAALTGVTVTALAPTRFPAEATGAERRVSPEDAVAQGLENNPAIAAAALRAVGGLGNQLFQLGDGDDLPVRRQGQQGSDVHIRIRIDQNNLFPLLLKYLCQ